MGTKEKIVNAIRDVENEGLMEEDIHRRIYCLTDMRIYANRVIDKLKVVELIDKLESAENKTNGK